MTQYGEIRDTIISVLAASGGTICDSHGRCANIITERCEYSRQQVSMSLSNLEACGRIEREVRGKRTYRVALVRLAEAAPPSPTPDAPVLELVPDTDEPSSVDLDELAGAILTRCAEILEGPKLTQVDAERLSSALDEAQRMRGRLRAAELELDGIRSERGALRDRIRLLEADKRTLQANLEHALNHGGRVVHEQVRAVVDEFMRETPTRHEQRPARR